ncbi:MAG: zinc ribbon domain-containing protein [Armatimonadota bacterium]|jgi:hypothetical protein
MAAQECPKCGATVQPTDAQCMDCGADLLEEQRKAERTLIETARLPVAAAAPPPTAAAMGRTDVGESSEETRLRIFDKHLAEALVSERLTAYVTAGIAFIMGLILAFTATRQLEAVGGLAGLKTLSPASVRHLGALSDNAVTGAWVLVAAVSAFLCFVGQTWRGVLAGKCIRAVEAGEKPVIVGISPATQVGLLLFTIICPPLGITLGFVLKLRPDEETSAFGGMLILAGLIALLVFALNWLVGLAGQLKTKPRPERRAPGAGVILYPLWTMASAMIERRRGR